MDAGQTQEERTDITTAATATATISGGQKQALTPRRKMQRAIWRQKYREGKERNALEVLRGGALLAAETLIAIAGDKKASQNVRVKAAEIILNRVYGNAVTPVAVETRRDYADMDEKQLREDLERRLQANPDIVRFATRHGGDIPAEVKALAIAALPRETRLDS